MINHSIIKSSLYIVYTKNKENQNERMQVQFVISAIIITETLSCFTYRNIKTHEIWMQMEFINYNKLSNFKFNAQKIKGKKQVLPINLAGFVI